MSTSQEVRQIVAEQAGAWFVANQSGSLDDAERAAFVAWLKASPVHVEEYLGVAHIARDLPAAADDPAFAIESLVDEARAADDDSVAYLALPASKPRSASPRPPRSRWQPAAATAAAFVLAVVAGTWWWTDSRTQGTTIAYVTGHGQLGAWRLADGSELRLNTDSSAFVRYSKRERAVELSRGQAHFQVAHDASRAFRVTAGEVEAIAVGTQFDVYRRGNAVVVTVAEGAVDVIARRQEQRVEAGYQSRVDAGGRPGEAVPVDVDRALAWLQHRIAFELRPLGEVADEFNRYGSLPIEIPNPALRALRISGVFDAADTDSFVAFIETLEGVRVERTPTAIQVLSEADQE